MLLSCIGFLSISSSSGKQSQCKGAEAGNLHLYQQLCGHKAGTRWTMDLGQILQAGLQGYISQTILILLWESAELLNTCQEL